jgi:hypothetical protein
MNQNNREGATKQGEWAVYPEVHLIKVPRRSRLKRSNRLVQTRMPVGAAWVPSMT